MTPNLPKAFDPLRVLFVLACVILAYTGYIKLTYPNLSTAQDSSQRVSPNAICTDVWEQESKHVNDHRKEKLPYFDVILTTDDCYGPFIQHPDDWQEWQGAFISNEPDRHISYWWWGERPQGPYGPNNIPDFPNAPMKWRLKGKGTMRYTQTR